MRLSRRTNGVAQPRTEVDEIAPQSGATIAWRRWLPSGAQVASMTPLPRTNGYSAWEADVGTVGTPTTAHALRLDPTNNWPLLPTCLDGLALYIDLSLLCDLHAILLEAWRALRLGGLAMLVPTLAPSTDTQARGRVAQWPGIARAVGFSIPPTLQSQTLFTGFLLRHHSWHMVQRTLTPWTPPPLVLCKGNVHGLHPPCPSKREND